MYNKGVTPVKGKGRKQDWPRGGLSLRSRPDKASDSPMEHSGAKFLLEEFHVGRKGL